MQQKNAKVELRQCFLYDFPSLATSQQKED